MPCLTQAQAQQSHSPCPPVTQLLELLVAYPPLLLERPGRVKLWLEQLSDLLGTSGVGQVIEYTTGAPACGCLSRPFISGGHCILGALQGCSRQRCCFCGVVCGCAVQACPSIMHAWLSAAEWEWGGTILCMTPASRAS
jgi:hypothetical protein